MYRLIACKHFAGPVMMRLPTGPIVPVPTVALCSIVQDTVVAQMKVV